MIAQEKPTAFCHRQTGAIDQPGLGICALLEEQTANRADPLALKRPAGRPFEAFRGALGVAVLYRYRGIGRFCAD